MAAGSILAAALWLALVTGLRAWRRRPAAGPGALLAAGLAEAYLLLPLAHFVLSDPGVPYYISAAANFVPESLPLQAAILIVTGAIAWVVSAARRRLVRGAEREPEAL